MPDNQHKNDDDLDIDGVINNKRLEELRKKYAAVEDDSADSFVSSSKENDHAQPEAPEVFTHETEIFSAESIEDLMSSFRVVYDEDDKSAENPPAQVINTQSPVSEPSFVPGQIEPQDPPKNKEADRDYLAGMRIVYEDPDEELSIVNKQAETVAEQPVFFAEELQPEAPTESLFETGESPSGLAELFEHAQEDRAAVKVTSFKRFVKNVLPHKGDSIGEILRKTVLNIAILTMIVCSGILLNIYVVSPYLNSREAEKTLGLKTNSNLLSDWAAAKDKYPGIDFPTGMQPKFADLFVTNKDFSGWLSIPSIGIDLPVVRGKNNAEYLTKSFYGEKSKYGCCFMDSSNGIAQLDRNTVIYGHNMKSDNLMLGPLEGYKTIVGFKAAPVVSFSTLYGDIKWKIYAVFISNGAESGDNGYLFNYIFRNLSSDEIFMEYVEQLDQRKLYTTGVDILPGDKILTISTCVYDFKDARLAVVARMVREGESEDVDLSKVVPKTSSRYPQAWYTAKGQTNPYKEYEKWSAK